MRTEARPRGATRTEGQATFGATRTEGRPTLERV